MIIVNIFIFVDNKKQDRNKSNPARHNSSDTNKHKLKKPDGKPFFQRLLGFLVKAVDDYPPIGQRSGRGCEPVASCEVVARQRIRGYLLDSGTYLLK